MLAVADADSYLKWSAATLDALPPGWAGELWLLRTPITPSAAQRAAATSRPVRVVGMTTLLRRLRTDPPDVLLLGCTGPVAQVLLGSARWWSRPRPVLVSGLPGISIPASARAVQLRAGVDLLVVHSRREQREFAALTSTPVGLARLPFLGRPAARGGADVVFAAQAKVPAAAADRRRVLVALGELPTGYRPVVKLRGTGGERQTHDEPHPYPSLGGSDRIGYATGAMTDALETAAGFATVSSTAALEAIDRGVPVLVLTDFGVSAAMINEVFADSGCFGTLADLAAARFATPDPAWLADNYFHPPVESDWIARLQELLAVRATAGLPAVAHRPVGRWPRRAWWALRVLWPVSGRPAPARTPHAPRPRRPAG